MLQPYPNTVYDVPKNLFSVLSSFWTDLFDSRDQVKAYVDGVCEQRQQTLLDLMNLLASMSRYTVPIYHPQRWTLVRLLESQRNSSLTNMPRYDGSFKYDGQISYDVPSDFAGFAFPKPAKLAAATVVLNRFVAPSLHWTNGADFGIDEARSAVIFASDPFLDPRVAKRHVYRDGEIVDQEAFLWMFNAEFDFETAYNQFGYAIRLRMKSSRGYRDLLNAVYDSLIGGGAAAELDLALSALTGIPLVREPTETVEVIAVQQNEQLIITDQHVYRYACGVRPLVAVGDVVHSGDQLTDAIRIDEFNRGIIPADLVSLPVGHGFLANCYYSDIVFEDKDVPLKVITDDPSGFTRVEFQVGGFPADIVQFFDDIHAKGVAAAVEVDQCYTGPVVLYPANDCDHTDVRRKRTTFAHLLDVRKNPIGEPTAASLPKKINPLQFLIANLFRNNVFLVRVKLSLLGTSALGLYQSRLLRRMVPPQSAMVLLVEVEPKAETIHGSDFTEELTTFTGMEPIVEELSASRIDDHRVAARVISFTCQ